jgi:hypothetical protein
MLSTPPLLIAAALLLWGAQTGMLVFGVLMAVGVELSRWIRGRLEFTLVDMNRVWDFCSLLTVLAGLYCVMSSDSINEVAVLFGRLNFNPEPAGVLRISDSAKVFFQWWPILLFPAVMAQAYGPIDRLPTTVYSILVRRRMKREGRQPKVGSGANFAYPYLAVCMYSGALTNSNRALFFWVFAIACFWGLHGVKSRRFASPVWALLVLGLVLVGFVGQREFPRAAAAMESQFIGMLWQWLRNKDSPNSLNTTIGDVGSMKGSGQIVMRVKAPGNPPELLPESMYWRFDDGHWDNPIWNTFSDVGALPDGESWSLNENANAPNVMTIARQFGGRLIDVARPASTALLQDLPVGQCFTNWLGTVRAGKGAPFIAYRAYYGGTNSNELDPVTVIDGRIAGPDLMISEMEDHGLRRVSKEIGIRWGQDSSEIVEAVSRFFTRKFEYSLEDFPTSTKETDRGETRIGRFLLDWRKGHCEYFASATVLLLRYHGVPARYVLGWSLQERGEGPGEFIVRDRHAHAWVRYWSHTDARWYDLDTTPPAAFVADRARSDWYEPLADWWSDRLHAFRMWRYYGTDDRWQVYLFGLLLPLIGYQAWRVFARRRRRLKLEAGIGDFVFLRRGLDSEFYGIVRDLAGAGFVRHEGETVKEWLARAASQAETIPEIARELVDLHYRYRFDPGEFAAEDRERLRDLAKEWFTARAKSARG